MHEIDELTRKRLDRSTSCIDVAPLDILRAMIDDIERGKIDCDGMLLIWCKRPAPDTEEVWTAGTYRANLTRDAELVQLELAKARLMHGWLGGA